MISLIKIKLIYNIRNPIKCFFNYILIGIILFIISKSLKALNINIKKKEIYFKCNDSTKFHTNEREASFYRKYALINNNKTIIDLMKYSSKANDFKYFEKEEEMIKYIEADKEKQFSTSININNNNEHFIFKLRNEFISVKNSINYANNLLDVSIDEKFGNDNSNDILFIVLYNFMKTYFKKNNDNKILKINSCFMNSNNYNNFTEYKLLFYRNLLPLFICIVYLIFFMNFLFEIVDEKEKQINLFLKKRGFKILQILLSNCFIYIILTSLSLFSIIYILKYVFIVNTKIFEIIISQFTFNISIYFMLYFIHNFIPTVFICQIFMFFFIIILFISGIIISLGQKCPIFFYIIFPFLNEIECIQILFFKENYINQNYELYFIKNYNINFFQSIIYFLLSIIFYFLGEILLELIQNYHYFIKCEKQSKIDNEDIEEIPIVPDLFNNSNNEDTQIKNTLKIINLNKEYGKKIIFQKLNIKFNQGEIFCLIGNNGVGKTTLLKIISGFEKANAGNILLNNHSIFLNKLYLNNNITLYSENEILFDYLTVEQYLNYMTENKRNKDDNNQINNILNLTGLLHKKNYLCNSLSNNQKKLLNLCLSLIGNEKVILLDEPTNGIDNIIKNNIWDYIKSIKKDKIIIITTNNMEEAEYLSDKIGYLYEGNLLCCGKSSYLKEKYNIGFNLCLHLNNKKFNFENQQNIINKLKQLNQDFDVKISSKNYISFSFKKIEENTNEIFKYIENIKEEYGIIDYNISTTSLEDVFLKINSEKQNNEEVKLFENNLEKKERINPFKELFTHILRSSISIFRLYDSLLIQLLIFFIFKYLLIYVSKIKIDGYKYLDLKKLLTENTIYINNNITRNYLENSSLIKDYNLKLNYKFYNSKPNLTLDTDLKRLISFSDEFLNESKFNNEKLIIYMDKELEENVTNFFYLFQIRKYYIRDIAFSWIYSSFLKNEYNINAVIFNEYGIIPKYKVNKTLEQIIQNHEVTFSHYIDIFIFIPLFFLFEGFCINLLVKDKEKKIKEKIKFNSGFMIYYWISFFLFDILKYIIIYFSFRNYIKNSILLNKFIPLFKKYFISIITFNYFLSSITFKVEQTYKTYYILFFIIVFYGLTDIIINSYQIIVNKDFEKIISYFFPVNFSTILNYIPLTSLIFAIIRIIISEIFSGITIYKVPSYDKFIDSHLKNLNDLFLIYLILFLFVESKIIEILYHIFINKVFLNIKHQFEFDIHEKKIINNNKNDNLAFSIDDYNHLNNNENKEEKLETLLIENSDNVKLKNEEFKDNNNNLSMKILNLTKTFYFFFNKNIRAINDLYLGLELEENIGILGFNGSGKTTLLKLITNEIDYEKGDITLFGNSKWKIFGCGKNYGFCTYDNFLIEYLTVKQLLYFYKNIKNSDFQIEDICNKLKLENLMNEYCVNLSNGDKQKLIFIISLMNYPKILLLDEPTIGIDPKSRLSLLNEIIEFSYKKNNIILCSNSIEDIEIICNQISFLNKGNFDFIDNNETIRNELCYELYIKFKEENNNKIKEEKEYKNINDLKVEGVNNINNLINSDPLIKEYCDYLYDIINNILEMCDKIIIKEIRKDYSFELNIDVKKEKKVELFTKLLSIKKENLIIDEFKTRNKYTKNI